MALIILIIVGLIILTSVLLRFSEHIGDLAYRFFIKPILNIFIGSEQKDE